MSITTIDFDDLQNAAGQNLGRSDWMLVDQQRIDAFADVVDDHQWIHTNPQRASNGPFGSTIAHGYLTLAAAASRIGDLLDVVGASSIINYGIERVRYPAPVRVGTRIRTQATIVGVTAVTGGQEVRVQVTAEADGQERPVCVAEVKVRYMR